MGFMDKLKDIGKKALGSAALAAAHSYGTVTAGEHNNCKVSMDNPMQKLVFIKLTELEAQVVIKDEIKTFSFTASSDASESYTILLEYNDGKTSKIHMSTDKNVGSNLPTPEQRIAARYADIGKLLKALATQVAISDNTKSEVNKLLRFAGIQEI